MTNAIVSYVEVCARSHYSFLLGASAPHELVEQAAVLGLSGLGLCDRDGLYGMPKAYLAAKNQPDFKFLVGAEVSFEDHPRLRFIAQDRAAYGVLSLMLTQSHVGQPKGHAALGWPDFLALMNRPAAHGLIAIPHDPLFDGQTTNFDILHEIFGERLYLPLSRFFDGFDRRRTQCIFDLQKRFGARIIATNDVHYHHPAKRPLQDLLTAIRLLTPLPRLGRQVFSNHERHLKSPQQMQRLFADLPEALNNTLALAERCRFSPAELRYRYPSEWIPANETAQSHLEKLVWAGTRTRYPDGAPEPVVQQLRHELQLIGELNFADYFLTLWEIVAFARSREILCQGRGSAANSVVCYCLGITAIDPVRMNLLFERFISAERGEPPDIDVDFEHERREEVIQHIYEKYGRHRAAMVAAVITYRRRSALRDTCRAFDVAYQDYINLPATSPVRRQIETMAEQLTDTPRHLSIHSGGFTLSADALHEIVPIEPARMPGRSIVQWDKYDLDALGLLKVDILALGMLTAVHKALDLTGLRLEQIPADDAATYQMIRRADTVGVFQIESRAQMNMAQRLLPENYYDLVVQIALVRPGPIVGKMVHPYLRRRQGLEAPDIPDPRLLPILGRTLGVPLFQEQVMKMAITLAGFSPGEADELRRSIGAWRSSGSIEKMGRRLQTALLKNGLPQAYVDLVFEQIKGFAEYGFPESHSASFALIAYASAYLKCHFPAAFACALVNSQPLGFYAVHSILDDVKRHGVCVLPVDPQRSYWDCHLEQGALRVGFRVVHGLHEKEALHIQQQARQKSFSSIADFVARVGLRPPVLEALAMADFFQAFGCSAREALWEVLRVQPIGQMDLFAASSQPHQPAPVFAAMDAYEAVVHDYAAYHLSTKSHPMAALRERLHRQGHPAPLTVEDLRQKPHNTWVHAVGMVIVRQRPQTAKGTIFAAFEDETGILDLMLHREVYARFESLFVNHAFLIASGPLQRDRNAATLIVKHLAPLQPPQNAARDLKPLLHAHEWH